MAIKNLGRVVGASAYQIWLEQGNTGTEEDFLDSLKATTGLNNTSKTLLINILRNALFNSNQADNITALETALSSGSSSGGDDVAKSYVVLNNLTNVTNSNTANSIVANESYTATLTIEEGYTLETITITMGGVDITDTAYSDGNINISSVTENIVITAIANIQTAYVQDGLLHEFTNISAKKTISGGQSIFNSQDDFTVFATFKGFAVDVIGLYNSTNTVNGDQFAFGTEWNGTVGAKIFPTNSTYPTAKYTYTDENVITHACVVKSGNTYTLYKDGVSKQSMGSGGLQPILDGDLVVNNKAKTLNKVLIYNRALTQEEITQNHNAISVEVSE